MANIVIDPVIIVVPADDASKVDAESWLENLAIWLKEALTAPFTWLHYRQASELLEAHGQFPNFARLKQLQQKHRLDINISQIARNINGFFRDDTLDLENHLNRLNFIIEPEVGSISIEPKPFITRLPPYLHNRFYILLADCCACKHRNFPFMNELHFATLALASNSREITVSVIILDALPDFVRPADNKIVKTFPL